MSEIKMGSGGLDIKGGFKMFSKIVKSVSKATKKPKSEKAAN